LIFIKNGKIYNISTKYISKSKIISIKYKMRSNKVNNKQSQTKHRKNRSISWEKISKDFEDEFFKEMKMNIKEDFIDPMDGMFGFDNLEKKNVQKL